MAAAHVEGSPGAAPRPRLDPRDWQGVYERAGRNDGCHAFRRVTDAAEAICTSIAVPGVPWLDVGCGTGELVERLHAGGVALAAGVDSDPAMIAFAAARHRRRRPGAAAPYVVGDACRLGVAAGAVAGVSAIWLSGCLEDPARFFAEARRVLAPGGHLVVSFTNAQAAGVVAWDWWRRRRGRDVPAARRGAYRRYAPREARALVEQQGLAIVRMDYLNCFLETARRVVPPPAIARRLERVLPAALRPCLCSHLLVVARA